LSLPGHEFFLFFAISASYDSMEPDEIGVFNFDSIASTFSLFFSFLFYRRRHICNRFSRYLIILNCLCSYIDFC
jgi:hypothetical protein